MALLLWHPVLHSPTRQQTARPRGFVTPEASTMTAHHPPTGDRSRSPFTRRQFLRYGGLSLAALPLLPITGVMYQRATIARQLDEATPAGEMRAGEWTAGEAVSAFTTGAPVQFTAPFPFGALGAHWPAGE